MENGSKNPELKRLGFVRIAAIQALICVSNLYDYAKQNAGPLKTTVGTVEDVVTSVAGPVYERFKGVPNDLLVFLDDKVDEATHKFDEHAPPLVKKVVNQTENLIHKASSKAQEHVNEARTKGTREAVRHAAADYKQLVINQTVKIWIRLNQIRPVHTVAEIIVPTAAHLSEKYNSLVKNMVMKGYNGFRYLPLVPVEEIAKAFDKNENEKKENKSDSDSDSDSD